MLAAWCMGFALGWGCGPWGSPSSQSAEWLGSPLRAAAPRSGISVELGPHLSGGPGRDSARDNSPERWQSRPQSWGNHEPTFQPPRSTLRGLKMSRGGGREPEGGG